MRAELPALRSGLKTLPRGLDRSGRAVAAPTELDRTEFHRFAAVLHDADPHAANEMMREVLLARGEE